jgi:S-adenosylmethionine:tRNA ribosyltransferase-isomerase
MRTDLFDFALPEERIALRPIAPRDAARLLVVRPNARPECEDRTVRDLPVLLRRGDALVVNDTKVLPAALHGRRIGRGDREPEIAATLIKRLDGSRWRALVKPAKRLEAGDVVRFGAEGRVCFLEQLDATVENKGDAGEITLAFAFTDAVLDQALEERGDMPLPPYIASRRAVDEQDRGDYQTMFASTEGSVAAPTAGLHFTENLTQALHDAGIALHRVTLHVGPGTFLPVKAADTEGHKMHPEWGSVSADTAVALNAARRAGGRLVAVGSTALRLL